MLTYHWGSVVVNTVAGTQPDFELDGEAAATKPGRQSSGWARKLPAVVAVLVGTLLICAHAALYGHWLVDDAAITFDYARNVAQGYGPVLQPGAAPVEGYSNTLWLVLLVFGRWLGLFDHGLLLGIPDYVGYPKLLAVLFCAGTLVAFHQMAAVLVRRAWIVTLGAGVLLACIPSYVAWSFSGLENSLYAFLVTAIAAVTVRAIGNGRMHGVAPAVTVGLLAFGAALTRPDGMIFAVSFPLVALLLMKRSSIRATLVAVLMSLASFAIPFGLFLLWRHAEFGRYVSNTAAAKSQSLNPNAKTITAFNKIGSLISYVGVVGVLVALVVIGATVGTPSPFRRRLVGALVPLTLAITAFGILNPDWMSQYRFATPIWAMGSLVVTVCAYRIISTAALRTRVVCGVAIAAALTSSLTLLKQQESAFRASPTAPLCLVTDSAGRLVNQLADVLHLPDSEVFVGPDLGGTSLTARLRLVDLAGLTDTRIADYRATGDIHGLAGYLFGKARPALMHAELAWKITGWDPRLDTDYYFLDSTDPAKGGMYVRKDLVSGPAMLEQLRTVENTVRTAISDHYGQAPRSSCGNRLLPGQVLGA
jgi:hypothetical protein